MIAGLQLWLGVALPEPVWPQFFRRHLFGLVHGSLDARLCLTVRILQVLQGTAPGTTDTGQLKAAGYRAETQYDAHLRAVLGKRRWEKYDQDPARIVCAAVISDGASAGYDMRAVITKVFAQRPWEDDPISSARSIARIMAHRIARELADPKARRTYAYPLAGHEGRTSIASSPAPLPPASSRTEPMPVSPYDDHLRALLGENRWAQYEHDERRRDIATLLSDAGAQGHDVTSLLNEAFESRKWEDDERSPARRFGGVLHYRVRALIATGRFLTTSDPLGTVAQTVSRSGAPTTKGHGSEASTEPGRLARTLRQQTVAQRD